MIDDLRLTPGGRITIVQHTSIKPFPAAKPLQIYCMTFQIVSDVTTVCITCAPSLHWQLWHFLFTVTYSMVLQDYTQFKWNTVSDSIISGHMIIAITEYWLQNLPYYHLSHQSEQKKNINENFSYLLQLLHIFFSVGLWYKSWCAEVIKKY